MRQIEAARAKASELGIFFSLRPRVASAQSLRRYFENVDEPAAGEFCTDPWNMVMIQTNGDVIPAHGRCFNTIAGNLNHASLPTIWNGPAIVGFRRLLKTQGGLLPACTRCCGCFDHKVGRAEKAAFSLQRMTGIMESNHAGPTGKD
jgi:MoaA/NifB/PqqE/SkfB family radical SAM enzyme